MQGANKTINTKVGLDLAMSEQVRQRQVTLIPRGCTVPSLEMRRISCLLRLSLLYLLRLSLQFLPTMLTSLLPDISILVIIAFQT